MVEYSHRDKTGRKLRLVCAGSPAGNRRTGTQGKPSRDGRETVPLLVRWTSWLVSSRKRRLQGIGGTSCKKDTSGPNMILSAAGIKPCRVKWSGCESDLTAKFNRLDLRRLDSRRLITCVISLPVPEKDGLTKTVCERSLTLVSNGASKGALSR